MINNLWRRIHQKGASWTDSIVLLFFLTYILDELGMLVGGNLVPALVSPSNDDFVYTFALYFRFIGVWIVFLLYFLTERNRFMIGIIGRELKGDILWKLLLGFLIGFLMNGACVFAAVFNGDIHLYPDGFRPAELLLLLLSVFVQSSAEEIAFRGFLYQRLRQSYIHPEVAILGNALLFAFKHLRNPGISPMAVVFVLLAGVVFTVIMYVFDSLVMAMAAHAAWNYTENIIFGLPNSGIVTRFSIFKLDAASARNSLFYSVDFGIEESFMAVLVMGLTMVLLLVYRKNKKH